MRIKLYYFLFIFGLLIYPINNSFSLKAHKLNYEKNNISFIKKAGKTDFKSLTNENNQYFLDSSFYKNGYLYQESLVGINQFFDLLGISLKSKELPLSFPEKRIEKDSFLFWKDYKSHFAKQLNYVPKLTRDIDNGFNLSLGEK